MIKKILISVFISISILCFFSGSLAYAATSGDYEYRVLDNGTVEITKWDGNDTRILGNSIAELVDD